ncbi:MAG: hypothetical protein R3C58_01970 [Parvularculaceae bacterium]
MDVTMEALMRMLADGWLLALAGFAAGLALGAWLSRAKGEAGKPAETGEPRRPSDADIAAIEAEIRAARQLLEAEEAEAGEAAEALKNLDEAIKRANGRLKLMLKAVEKGD